MVIQVTLRFQHKNVPIEITVDASCPGAIDFSIIGGLIDASKKAIDQLDEGKKLGTSPELEKVK